MIDTPVQFKQGGKALAVGNGGTLGADAGSLIDFSGVPAGSTLDSVQEGLTALAGGGVAGATPITATIARFTTVATNGDSGVLPPAVPGVQLTVINAGAASLDVYPATAAEGGVTGGDAINALAQGAEFSMATTKVTMFFCTKLGQWHTLTTS